MMTPNGAFAISSSRVLITTDFQDLHKTISHIPYSSSYICVKYQCRNQPRNVPRDEECGKSDKSLYCFLPSCEIPYFSFPYRHFHFPGSLYGTIAPTILRVRVLLPHPTLLFPCSIHRKQKKRGALLRPLTSITSRLIYPGLPSLRRFLCNFSATPNTPLNFLMGMRRALNPNYLTF